VDRTIDYSALINPVGKDEVAAFKAQTKASGVAWATAGRGGIVAAGCAALFVAVFFLIFGLTFVRAVFTRIAGDDPSPVAIVFAVFFVAVGIAVVAVIVYQIGKLVGTGRWEKWMRLSRFGQANGLVFSASDPNPQYPGAIFNQGGGRTVTDHLRSATDRFLDIGNYTYTTGSGKNQQTHRWGFMALHLDRRLPNMVLDAKSNNGLFGGTNLPAYFSKDQVLSLEGDFDRYFTLYCPRQYERDALYVFTPDLMALLIDEAATFDVEIVDDWMFVYSATHFRSTDPALYQRLFRIVDTVGAKTLSQTDRYVDERIGNFAANVVAPQGQRLKRGVSVGAIITIVAFVVIWALPQLLSIGR
jgi:hypothetical protein